MSTRQIALVVGSTGIVGKNLANHLTRTSDWTVYGLARNPSMEQRILPVAVNLLELDKLKEALAKIDVTHVFFCTWSRQATEQENCDVNGAMLRNLLDALDAAPRLTHVALATGTKNYLGSFDAFGQTSLDTPFREEQPRVPGLNFYYVQEDILFQKAVQRGFSWSVHRPSTMIGHALGNAMNMGVTLSVYATICRETGHPFVFPGSPQQYNGLVDVTDARLLARHIEWAATTPRAANQAFNIVNGDVFRWRWLWPQLVAFFGIESAPYPGYATPLAERMRDAGSVWERIVAKHSLKPYALTELASWWHTDADLGREIECLSDMSKSRELGFLDYQQTLQSFLDLFERLRRENIIP
ncbi:SDR family oxidoreductase [uncultured Nostoc sp.]|uniref:SDR family oxidoreductase n=1 Tax=uncultured Nostoc sp. TaxID=340711 RepID=UPI0035CBF2F8